MEQKKTKNPDKINRVFKFMIGLVENSDLERNFADAMSETTPLPPLEIKKEIKTPPQINKVLRFMIGLRRFELKIVI